MATDHGSTGDVKLLAGGNPQIPKGDGDGPVQAYLAAMPDWKGEIGRHLDDLVNEVAPEARKAVRWNSPFYGVEGNGWFLSLHCFTKYVKVTWLNGAQLDPPPPVTSKDERVRYSNIATLDEIDDDQVRDWIRQAAQAPGDPLF
ncbi:DUF1801 domain-containing protein [Ilumatobacter coccineus]|jgi:hypothetical protein|uniref:YdhG-like domain-containing protein n=1 Tax=Ilumatobacter coccineus (strain NBRC 103263 / KCTC 29153 / YM16-304) TaxID=1313172 RepID=A0A6C7EDN0_ILUCY|nr:DUF1801 domain-containing protein [Ilumatobacter coccineus]BAN04480.1 hypothetical protein YM304_41660 [Ilumatobacter coccineus YM16-304]